MSSSTWPGSRIKMRIPLQSPRRRFLGVFVLDRKRDCSLILADSPHIRRADSNQRRTSLPLPLPLTDDFAASSPMNHRRVLLFCRTSSREFATKPKPEQQLNDLPEFSPAPSFRLTKPPNPKWEPCCGTELDTHDVHGVKTWNPVLMSSRWGAVL